MDIPPYPVNQREFWENFPDMHEALDVLADACHKFAMRKGFNLAQIEFGTAIALIHSELSEALEHNRAGTNDKHLSEYPGEAVEIADTIIRAFHLAGHEGWPIGEILLKKMAYGTTRPYKHGKKY